MGFFNKKTTEEKMAVAEKIMQEKEDEKNIYEMNIMCENCDDEVCYEIPIGTTVADFKKTLKCQSCGCSIEQNKYKDALEILREIEKNTE